MIREEQELAFPGDDLKEYKIANKEINMAVDLINKMYAPWQPEKYHDDYQDMLMKWIEDKIPAQSEAATEEKSVGKRDEVIDFMALLKQSMRKQASNKPKKSKKASK